MIGDSMATVRIYVSEYKRPKCWKSVSWFNQV